MTFRLIVLICGFFCSVIHGQESALKVDHVNFEGLTRTKPDFLNELLNLKVGGEMDVALLEKDLQILKNLSPIASAEIQVDTTLTGVKLLYRISERKTALPIINFGGITGNVWFSLGAIDNNFTGQGDLALAYYQNNNGRHTGELFYRRPRFSKSRWGGSVSVRSWASLEPLFFEEGTVQYLYDNNGLGLTAIWNQNIHNQIEFGATYFKEVYRQDAQQEVIPTPGPVRFSLSKVLSKIQLSKQHLRHHFFYLTGYEFFSRYQVVHSLNGDPLFNSLRLQAKAFWRPRPKLNLAIRTVFAISTNDDSPFAPFVADSHVNLRGVGNRIDRGTAQAVLNVELRYTLRQSKIWSSQAVLYSDAGTWRSPGGKLSNLVDRDKFRHFVGAGFRLHYQKFFGAILRLDYGFDVYAPQQNGAVIGLNQYF